MTARATSVVYIAEPLAWRACNLASWPSGMHRVITVHSYRLGVVDEPDLLSPGFFPE